MPRPEADDSDEPETTKTVKLTEKDVPDAARPFRLIVDPESVSSRPIGFTPVSKSRETTIERETLISRARIVFNSRRLRERFFGEAIFGEPAWDIMLLLYISEQSLGRLTATALAGQIQVPLTTVVRWLNHLEMERFIERRGHPNDRRATFIRLGKKGRNALDSYLGSISG